MLNHNVQRTHDRQGVILQQNPLLNFKEQGQGQPVVLIHGLFGSLDNLGLLARPLSEQYRVISVDLRNHGASFHSDEMSYPAQAADLLALLDRLELEQVAIVGHSMGGKVGMQLAKLAPTRVAKLVVADIAPVATPPPPPECVRRPQHHARTRSAKPQRGRSNPGAAHRDPRRAPVPAQVVCQNRARLGLAFQRPGP
ncbi:alpha/beta fold hydrolase [Aeromonas hydrophila]